MHVLCGPGGGLRHGARARRRGLCRGDLVRGGGAVRVLTGSRPAKLVVLVTTTVVRDTLLDCHFSAWSRPKPAPDPLPGPSVASGVIPTKGGINGPVPATSGRASTGRWRSSPWKRCNHAAPRGRVREHPAPLGALRRGDADQAVEIRHRQGAPRTARCIKTHLVRSEVSNLHVREHPAPLGALRPPGPAQPRAGTGGQGPPRTFASPAHHLTGGPR